MSWAAAGIYLGKAMIRTGGAVGMNPDIVLAVVKLLGAVGSWGITKNRRKR